MTSKEVGRSSLEGKEIVRMEAAKSQKAILGAIKRCPQCFSSLTMDEMVCPSCNQKLKASINKHGYAKKPVNWHAYLMCLLSWAGMALYIWWAFFK
jgi:hypothetical protein